MAQILHKRATITHAIRAELQRSTESVATLSKRYNLNPKTVRKWRARHSVEGAVSPLLNINDALPRSGGDCLQEKDATTFR